MIGYMSIFASNLKSISQTLMADQTISIELEDMKIEQYMTEDW